MALEELLVGELLYAQHSVDGVVALDVEHILYGTSLRGAVALGQLVALHPVAASLLCEEEHHVVHRCGIDILGEVAVAVVGSLVAHSAAALLAELAQRSALDVAQMADGDNHWVVGIKVLCVELLARVAYLSAALVAIFLLHFLQLVLHHLLAELGVGENLLQVSYELLQVVVLLVQLLHAQTSELAQTHVDDSLCLHLVEVETLHEVLHSLTRTL